MPLSSRYPELGVTPLTGLYKCCKCKNTAVLNSVTFRVLLLNC